VEIIPPSNDKSAVKADKMFDVNEKYVRDIKKLKKQGKDDIIKEIKLGHKTLVEVKKEQRAEKIATRREQIEKEAIEKPEGNFDVIVIDPPWDYGTDDKYNPEGFRGTCPYPTMSLEEIKAIKLPAKEDCVLWLWTTNKFLLEMKPLLEEWGFELKSILTWDKEHIAIGSWLRSQTEHCILAIKGKPFFHNTKYGTLLREKRSTHSKKPDSFYKMVDEICAGKKLDYFARNKREGWEVYGDEVK
jgi:N6-adenosine-specific RNA methylase IME4